METNENPYNVSTSVYNPQLRTLLSIRDFGTGLEAYKSKVLSSTQKLIHTYEDGILILEAEANQDFKNEWVELINEVRVHSNHLNQYLETAEEKSTQNRDFPFKGLWKEFEDRLKMLKESSQKFENLGAKALPKERKEYWEKNICIFEKTVLPEIELNAKAVKLVLQFKARYTPQELDKISKVIIETMPEGSTFKDAKEYEAAFLKAMREFQKEFEAQDNLWDTIMEILAGGVHPSPSERVMFNKWIDGEQKTREEM